MSFHRLVSPKACSGLGGLALAVLLASTGAQAADYLRGAYGGHQGVEPIGAPRNGGVDWAGVYVGGHVGVSNVQRGASRFYQDTANAALLPNSAYTNTLSSIINRSYDKRGTSFGAFGGINYVWDDVVLGMEADYSRNGADASSTIGPFSRAVDVSASNIITGTAIARAKVSSWGTLRGRVGWAAGSFMPYLTAGVAVGAIDARTSVQGTWQTTTSGSYSTNMGREGVALGGVLGAGMDVAIISNVFLRAEWQTIHFASNNNRPAISINTARVAGGVKF